MHGDRSGNPLGSHGERLVLGIAERTMERMVDRRRSVRETHCVTDEKTKEISSMANVRRNPPGSTRNAWGMLSFECLF